VRMIWDLRFMRAPRLNCVGFTRARATAVGLVGKGRRYLQRSGGVWIGKFESANDNNHALHEAFMLESARGYSQVVQESPMSRMFATSCIAY
jgi:hypothetical protein